MGSARMYRIHDLLSEDSPSVILIAGLPGHGKSTLASQLSTRHGLTHLEVDSMRGDAASRYRQARREAWIDINAGRHVIMAACAVSMSYRSMLMRGLECARACVWFRPDYGVMRRRRPSIVDHEWWRLRVDEPTQAEGFGLVVVIDAL